MMRLLDLTLNNKSNCLRTNYKLLNIDYELWIICLFKILGAGVGAALVIGIYIDTLSFSDVSFM